MLYRINNPWNFNSELQPPQGNPGNWVLRLELRIRLNQRNRSDTYDRKGIIADSDGQPFWVDDWHAGAWHNFVTRYQYHCQRFWHNRFWLMTPNDVPDLDWPSHQPTHRPNVLCHFSLQAGAVDPCHYEINVWRATRPVFPSDDGWSEFRSNSQMYDVRDLLPAGGQITVLHEVGHLLGLEHEGIAIDDPACRAAASPNAPECYSPRHPQGRYHWGLAIMGTGMLLAPHHARPWVERIQEHVPTQTNQWHGFLQHQNGQDHPRLLSGLPAADFAEAAVRGL